MHQTHSVCWQETFKRNKAVKKKKDSVSQINKALGADTPPPRLLTNAPSCRRAAMKWEWSSAVLHQYRTHQRKQTRTDKNTTCLLCLWGAVLHTTKTYQRRSTVNPHLWHLGHLPLAPALSTMQHHCPADGKTLTDAISKLQILATTRRKTRAQRDH